MRCTRHVRRGISSWPIVLSITKRSISSFNCKLTILPLYSLSWNCSLCKRKGTEVILTLMRELGTRSFRNVTFHLFFTNCLENLSEKYYFYCTRWCRWIFSVTGLEFFSVKNLTIKFGKRGNFQVIETHRWQDKINAITYMHL